MINKKNKNRIEYEIYKNPKTGKVNKIVSIEYRKKDLEITDYYYTSEGKVNFIYQRKDSIYTPTYASPDKTGSRYYFDKDCLLKWRWVDKPLDVRERVLKKDKNDGANIQYLYKKSKKKDRKNYDKREIKMLNAAYNTYEAMLKENEYGGITGNVVNTKGKALKDVKIEIYFGADLIGEIKTDKKGRFETGITPNKEGYKLKITKEGFADTEVENVTVKDTGSIVLIDKIILVKAGEGKKKLKFNVFNAEATKYNNQKAVKKYIDKVKIKVRKGTDNKDGEIIAESKSDSKGNITLSLENGIYTIEFVKKGFVKSYQTIAVEKKSAMNIPLVKNMKKNQLKIVLTWEGDKDIDSSLFTPYQGKGGDMAYVGAGTKKDKHGNRLVNDGKKGNTVEVITIDNAKAGNYKYYVSDYTNSRKKKFSSKDMKNMKLKVVVYDENGVAAYYTLPYDVNGVIWEVFEIKNGELIPLQKTYSNVTGKKWWTKDKTPVPKNLKAHLEYEKILRGIMADPDIAFGKFVDGFLESDNGSGDWFDERRFAYHDFDGDGVDELICFAARGDAEFGGVEKHLIYSCRNGKASKIFVSPVMRIRGGEGARYDFYLPYLWHDDFTGVKYFKITNGRAVEVESFANSSSYPITPEQKKYRSSYVTDAIFITEANISKYRNTYNSTAFRKEDHY